MASRDRPANAAPMPVSNADGWWIGVRLSNVSLRLSDADAAVPNADNAQRPFVMRLTWVRSPLPVNRMKARSWARPGLGSYQPGSVTASGSMASMSSTAEPRSRGPPPPPRTCTGTPAPMAAACSPCSGSAMMRVTRPRAASRWRNPSGRSITATAPSRLRAATMPSALGRVSMSTPTCAPWRTPMLISPRTTLSMRSLAAA